MLRLHKQRLKDPHSITPAGTAQQASKRTELSPPKDFLGGDKKLATPELKIDEAEQADLKRQLAIMMAPKA